MRHAYFHRIRRKQDKSGWVLFIFYVFFMFSDLNCSYLITKASFVVDVLLNSSCRSFADVFVFLCILPA